MGGCGNKYNARKVEKRVKSLSARPQKKGVAKKIKIKVDLNSI
jgi:hypothetical protein